MQKGTSIYTDRLVYLLSDKMFTAVCWHTTLGDKYFVGCYKN